jgi:hypothetical protein
MSNPKRHHFVPESYLNGFVDDESGFLNVYSKRSDLWRRQKPKQVMVRNKYYHQHWAPDGIDKNILEKKLGSEFEPKGLSAIRKLTETHESISDDDTVNIITYLEFQRFRVPRQADMAMSLAQAVVTRELSKSPMGCDVLKGGSVVMKDSYRIEFIRTVIGSLCPYFSRMIWEVVGVEDGLSFVTSDSPVSLFNVDLKPPAEPGPALFGTKVLFPINKYFLLILRHPEYERKEKGASEALPKDLEVNDGEIELRKGVVWNEKEVQSHNWVMYQLSQDLIVGESREVLENVVGKTLVGSK